MEKTHLVHRHPLPAAGVLALISLPVHLFLPEQVSYAFAAILLGMISGIYVGFAVIANQMKQMLLQLGVALTFVGFSLFAWHYNPLSIAAGYIAHGLWDAAHHYRISDLAFPRWYIPLCAAYDILAGLGLFVIWLSLH